MANTNIQEQLEALASSKNPLSLLFSIAKARELVEEFADGLMNGIEKAYYETTSELFVDLIEGYEKSGFFKVIYAYYEGSGQLSAQKAYLDKYFEESYWRDVDFYFYVLEKHPQYRMQFELLRYFYENQAVQKEFLACTDETSRGDCLVRIEEELGLRAKDYVRMPACIDFFEVLVAELSANPGRKISNVSGVWKNYGRRIARDLYLEMIADRSGPRVEFWEKYFINGGVTRTLLETIKTEGVFDCFRFLRMKLLKAPKYNIGLTDDNVFKHFIDRSNEIEKGSVAQKLDFIADTHDAMGNNPIKREQFQSVLRKGLMYNNSIDLLDAILWISFLSREAYYEVKRRALARKELVTSFENLERVKTLASMLESSLFLRFLRPFLIARLARVFNKSSDLYYFIKFILTIHESEGYSEYKMLSRFFLSLEAFGKSGIYGWLLRAVQFGWLFILAVVLFFVAPLGTFLALLWLFIVRIGKRAAERRFPEIALTSNFQFASYLVLIGVISLSFGLSFGLKDNTAIVYDNFRTVINASTLVASESLSALSEHMSFKASSIEHGEGSGTVSSILERIDYNGGKTYKELSK